MRSVFVVTLALVAGCAFRPEGTASIGGGTGGALEDGGGSGGAGGAGGAGPRDGSPDRMVDAATVAGDVARPPDVAGDVASVPDVSSDLPRDMPPPTDVPVLPRVIFAVGDEPLGAADMMVADRLAGLGLRVRTMVARNRDDGIAIRDAAMADGKLIVVSSSLQQGTGVVTVLQPVAIPIICTKPEFIDSLNIGQQSDTTPFNTEIAIIAPGHPLAGGRSGTIAVATQPTVFGWGRPIDNAVAVATESGNRDHVIIFGVDRGTTMQGGPAPARRVAFLAIEATFRNFNAIGWALFDTAVRWAMGNI
jgi:hypothetical protein